MHIHTHTHTELLFKVTRMCSLCQGFKIKAKNLYNQGEWHKLERHQDGEGVAQESQSLPGESLNSVQPWSLHGQNRSHWIRCLLKQCLPPMFCDEWCLETLLFFPSFPCPSTVCFANAECRGQACWMDRVFCLLSLRSGQCVYINNALQKLDDLWW